MTEPKHTSIERIEDALFDQLSQQNIRQRNNSQVEQAVVSEDDYLSLHCLFERTLAKALKLVDEGSVECLVGQFSRRRIFRVQGRSATDQYLVLPSRYCSCQAFFFEAVSKGDATHCKHMLAARFAEAVGALRTTEVADEELARVLIDLCAEEE
mmetsp:Transcript_37991/g.90245  ORF Transcript_37991/g.90245 Transcript_37991/m.90245 type:complete len:154 (-) Transcript_37991:302-763(-)